MISYFKNAFKEVVKNCTAVDHVKIHGVFMNGGEIDLYNASSQIEITLRLNFSKLKLSEEGQLRAVGDVLPMNMQNMNPGVVIESTDSDDILITYAFYTQVGLLRDVLDKELNKVYFDRVEEALDQAADTKAEECACEVK